MDELHFAIQNAWQPHTVIASLFEFVTSLTWRLNWVKTRETSRKNPNVPVISSNAAFRTFVFGLGCAFGPLGKE
jgi:hypothetical protein